MSLGQTYSTGSVSIDTGTDAKALVFTGTLLTQVAIRADIFWANGQIGFIESIVDDTHVTLYDDWTGGDLTDADYRIYQASTDRYDPSLTQQKLREFLAALDDVGKFWFVDGAAPDAGLGEDGDFALKVNAAPWQLWTKASGAWVLQGQPAGTSWKGPWDSLTAFVVNDVVQRLGSSYVCTVNNTNTPPESNPDKWQLQASKGDTGQAGGAIIIPLSFQTSQSDSDPGGPGGVRLITAGDQSAATMIIVDLTDVNNLDLAATFASLAARTSSIKGLFSIFKNADTTARIWGTITAVTSATGYRKLTIGSILGASATNPFSAADALSMALDWSGDKGDTGPAPTISGTSTSNISVPSSATNVSFATQAGIAWSVGQRLRAVSGSKIIEGQVNSYSGTALVIAADYWEDSGSATSWTISIAGARGAMGNTGNPGPAGVHWEGAWDVGTTYTASALVSASGKVWISIAATTGDAPASSPSKWQEFFNPLAPLNAITVQTKTANYLAVAADRGTMLNFTSSATLMMTAAATLGNGWYCYVKGNGAAVTVDPDSTEQIDGSITKVIGNGSAAIVICTGTAFVTFSTSSGGGSLSTMVEQIKTGDYTITTSDVGQRIVHNSSSPHTFALPAAATATAGFAVWVRNIGTGSLTVDGDGSETIDGDLTIVLDKDEECLLTCTGTGWRKSFFKSEGHLEPETDVAAAATMDIGGTNTERIRQTGAAASVTSFGTRARKRRIIRWTSRITVTHSGTSLILPGAPTSLTTDAGDIWTCESDASGNWRVTNIFKTATGTNRAVLGSNRTYYVGFNIPTPSISIASPAVVSSAAHGLSVDDAVVFAVPPNMTVATISAANPGVVSMTNTFSAGRPVKFSSTGLLPIPLVANTDYYVISASLSGSQFEVSATVGGSAINTTPPTATFTNGSANIGVTNASTYLKVGQLIRFATTGSLPTNFATATDYYVKTVNTTTVTVSATATGSAITAGSAGSGTQTVVQTGTHYVSTSGALPTGIDEGAVYYVIASGYGTNSFQVSTSKGGAAVNTSGSVSGTPIYNGYTGNDQSDGLSNTATGALLTIDKSRQLAFATDLSIYNVTVQLSDGTFPETIQVSGQLVGSGSLTFNGNATYPGNVRAGNPSNFGVRADGSRFNITNMRIRSGGTGHDVNVIGGANVNLNAVELEAAPTTCLLAQTGGTITCTNFKVLGSAQLMASAQFAHSSVKIAGTTVAFLDVPAFSQAVFDCSQLGAGQFVSNTISGTCTGKQHDTSGIGFLQRNGVDLPGNIAGTTGSGWAP
jgi:hypothetical protein